MRQPRGETIAINLFTLPTVGAFSSFINHYESVNPVEVGLREEWMLLPGWKNPLRRRVELGS